MAKNWNPSWASDVGVNHTPAYQVSGRPFTSGSIDPNAAAKNIHGVKFPYVTRWIYIVNRGAADVQVAFSRNGFNQGTAATDRGPNTNAYFTIPAGHSSNKTFYSSTTLELKVSEIYLKAASTTTVDVVAGMTSIRTNKVSGAIGPSWSGSIGVY
tara:strand:- start:42 stop:506 length:465 start_codon:yes stop_codon:yes gene_type:complete